MLAEGGDNIAVYAAFFATLACEELLLALVVFYLLLLLFLAISVTLVQCSMVAKSIQRFGFFLIPLLFFALGVFILFDNGSLALIAELFAL